MTCSKCGQPENLAEPFIGGVCQDCLRKSRPAMPGMAAPPATVKATPRTTDWDSLKDGLAMIWNGLTYLCGALLMVGALLSIPAKAFDASNAMGAAANAAEQVAVWMPLIAGMMLIFMARFDDRLRRLEAKLRA